jgi:KDO2-lipid IV(A) lauroyltransferase
MPKEFFYRFSIGLGTLAYYLVRKHRKLTLANLRRAFGNSKDENEYRKIAKEVFRQIALGGCETAIAALYKSGEQLKKEIEIEGLEYLKRALQRGKGAIVLSAHLGNFTLMCARLSQENFPFKTVIRDPDDEAVADFFERMRNRLNVELINAKPRNVCVRNSIEFLRQNGVLCLLADQSKNKGVFVKFFGHLSGTVAGPAVMALRTGAPIIPVFIVRKDKINHKIIVHPPLEVSLSGDYHKDIFEITQKFTTIIEEYARSYPEQWWWVHQRWKHQPKT